MGFCRIDPYVRKGTAMDPGFSKRETPTRKRDGPKFAENGMKMKKIGLGVRIQNFVM